MDKTIQYFIDHKLIAVVGASRDGGKFGNSAAKELQERGYEVFYIHPEAEEIDNHPTYPNLDAVKDQVECVWVSVSAEHSHAVLHIATNHAAALYNRDRQAHYSPTHESKWY